jgi:hypothetical protein
VSPVTVIGDPAALAVNPPGVDVAVYPVMTEPPLNAGGVNATVACVLPAVAVPIVGALGTVNGVTLLEAADSALLPAMLVACTVNVYAVPLASPETTMGDAAPVPVKPPGVDVTVYPVIGLPPSKAGPVNVTLACALPAVAVPIVGALGTVNGVTLFDAAEGRLSPMPLVAKTVKVYAVPFVRPGTLPEIKVPAGTAGAGIVTGAPLGSARSCTRRWCRRRSRAW